MKILVRVLAVLPALLFLATGLRWLADPAGAAAVFGMPLLEPVPRSTQIGDLGGLFLGGAVLMLIGAVRLQRAWLLAPAIVIGVIALCRVVAWQFHGAALLVGHIMPEVVIVAMLLFAASRCER